MDEFSDGAWWVSTDHLRWVNRRVKPEPPEGDLYIRSYSVLQQKWASAKGVQWRDIEIVDEE